MAKSHPSEASRERLTLLSTLEGRSCPDCPGGSLERDVYKDNLAIVCDSCGAPRVQVWDVDSSGE